MLRTNCAPPARHWRCHNMTCRIKIVMNVEHQNCSEVMILGYILSLRDVSIMQITQIPVPNSRTIRGKFYNNNVLSKVKKNKCIMKNKPATTEKKVYILFMTMHLLKSEHW